MTRSSPLTARRPFTSVLAIVAILYPALPAVAFQVTRPAADTRPAGPATGPAAAGAQRITVTAVSGRLTVISTDNGMTWQPVTVNMVVDPGAIFRTGPRSTITCVISPGDQNFVVESLTKLTVAEASRRGNQVRTDLIMDRGAVRYDIQAAGAEYESTVRTPSSTLAVRGTRTFVEDRVPFAPFAVSYTGQVEYRTAQRTARFGGRRVAAVRAGDGSAAQTALNQTVVDPSIALARTNAEAQLIADQTSQGAVVGFNPVANIPVVRGGAPETDEQIASRSNQPGGLSIFLRWTGNADLNSVHTATPITPGLVRQGRQLAEDIPLIGEAKLNDTALGQIAITFGGQLGGVAVGEVLYPGFDLNTTRSGGRIPFDHRGGPGGGQEVAFWVQSPPPGVYGVGAIHAGGQAADFKIDAFLDGEPLDIFFTQGTDENGLPVSVKSRTFSGTISADGEDAAGAVLYVPPNEFFSRITPDADPNFGGNGNGSGGKGAAANSESHDPQNPRAVARRLMAEGRSRAVAGGPPRSAAPAPQARRRELDAAVAAAKAAKEARVAAPARPIPSPSKAYAGPLRVTGEGARVDRETGGARKRPDLRVTGPRAR